MNNEFVPYDIALAMKELGFDDACIFYYAPDAITISKPTTGVCSSDLYRIIASPLYQQAFRWFREEHNIDCYIEKDRKNRYWFYITVNTLINKSSKFCYHRYEKAELACLRKLIEIVNQNKEDE